LPKIVAHEDMWSMADIIESIPLVGTVYRWAQPWLGAFFSRQVLARYAKRAGVTTTAQGPGALNTNTLHAAYHPIEAAQVGSKPLIGTTEEQKQRGNSKAAQGEDSKEL
jgi:hypothetical protein